MPKSITVRNVPDETTAELAARAALSGRSLQEYLRSRLIQMADTPDAETVVARMRARAAATGTRFSAEEIIALRDANRR
jgi:antitoxin FitA